MAVKVETRPKALQRQQMILSVLGYYQGICDGIWSSKTIAAMRQFESSGKFAPALPRNGLPLDLHSKMPPGIFRDTITATAGAGLLTCAGLDLDKITELTPNSTAEESKDLNESESQNSDSAQNSSAPDSDSGSDGHDGDAGLAVNEGRESSELQSQEQERGITITSGASNEIEMSDLTKKDPNTLTRKERKALVRQQNQN